MRYKIGMILLGILWKIQSWLSHIIVSIITWIDNGRKQ